MATFVAAVPIRSDRIAAPVAAVKVHQMMNVPTPATIAAVVGAGGTVLIEYTLTPTASTGWPGTAVWIPWTPGAVSVNTVNTLVSPVVAIRITSTVSDGIVEICA